MDTTVTAALIAAFVGLISLLYQTRQFHEQRKLTWLDRQLDELYGPMCALLVNCVHEVSATIDLWAATKQSSEIADEYHLKTTRAAMAQLKEMLNQHYALLESDTRDLAYDTLRRVTNIAHADRHLERADVIMWRGQQQKELYALVNQLYGHVDEQMAMLRRKRSRKEYSSISPHASTPK